MSEMLPRRYHTGTYYISMTSYNYAGVESDLSAEASVNIS